MFKPNQLDLSSSAPLKLAPPNNDSTIAMDVLTISQLSRLIKSQLNNQFPAVWVAGEISGVTRPSSGHVYFTLKDQYAQINAIVWASEAERLEFEITNGLKVVCRGGVDVYPPRGSYQLIVRKMQPEGIGALQLAFRQLHQKLSAEGLFDQHHKRPLPLIPEHVAVVTSPSGAAVRDFLQVLTRRWPSIRVTIVPARVQGQGAAEDIAAGIGICQKFADRPDVIVVTRGGGSVEDLWSFNEELVVRAIHASQIPVVSGVGHEIDVTLADLVADVRALTPSEAAERIVPDLRDVSDTLQAVAKRLQRAIAGQVELATARLQQLASRPVLTRPLTLVEQASIELDYLEQNLHRQLREQLNRQTEVIANLAQRLQSISPLSVLARGYSLTNNSVGNLIRSVEDVESGARITTRISDGLIHSQVLETEPRMSGQ